MEKNNVRSPSRGRHDLPTAERETAEALVDDLADTKLQLVKLGRRVFQLSSRIAAVRHEDEMFFDNVPSDHAFFGNENLTEIQLNEFYKSGEGYVALLKELNVQLLKLSGRLKK
jgi:hypothetical protein